MLVIHTLILLLATAAAYSLSRFPKTPKVDGYPAIPVPKKRLIAPGQRATIAKIDLGNAEHGDSVSVSLYRPHLFTTLARQDIDHIDFSLRDSRGVTLDLDGTRLAFVVTFSTEHLMG